jgi:predicted nucleic acid-binding protein
MIVVDTNILAYLYLPGEYTAEAEALLGKHADWVAPQLWRSEFRNILAGFIRRGALDLRQAIALQREAEALLAASEYIVDSEAVLELVGRSDCSAYDCEFVALAQMLDVKLVTMDAKILKAFPKVAIPLRAG